jgi:hypothetical protein
MANEGVIMVEAMATCICCSQLSKGPQIWQISPLCIEHKL